MVRNMLDTGSLHATNQSVCPVSTVTTCSFYAPLSSPPIQAQLGKAILQCKRKRQYTEMEKSSHAEVTSDLPRNVIAIESGVSPNIPLSHAGQRALSNVSPYWQTLSNLLLKNLRKTSVPSGFETIVAQRMTKLEQKQDLILKKLESIERTVRLSRLSETSASESEQINSMTIHNRSATSITAAPTISTDIPTPETQAINPDCHSINASPIAGLMPP